MRPSEVVGRRYDPWGKLRGGRRASCKTQFGSLFCHFVICPCQNVGNYCKRDGYCCACRLLRGPVCKPKGDKQETTAGHGSQTCNPPQEATHGILLRGEKGPLSFGVFAQLLERRRVSVRVGGSGCRTEEHARHISPACVSTSDKVVWKDEVGLLYGTLNLGAHQGLRQVLGPLAPVLGPRTQRQVASHRDCLCRLEVAQEPQSQAWRPPANVACAATERCVPASRPSRCLRVRIAARRKAIMERARCRPPLPRSSATSPAAPA